MSVRLIAVAAVAVAFAGAAAAEPVKSPARAAGQPVQAQPPVVVASAETPASPAPVAEAQNPAPAKRVRTARVSGCRCGGQTPSQN